MTLPSFLLLAVYFQLSVSAEGGGGRGGAWEGLVGWVLGGVGIGEPVGEMRVGGVRKFCWAEDPICILWTLEKFSILFRSRGH